MAILRSYEERIVGEKREDKRTIKIITLERQTKIKILEFLNEKLGRKKRKRRKRGRFSRSRVPQLLLITMTMKIRCAACAPQEHAQMIADMVQGPAAAPP